MGRFIALLYGLASYVLFLVTVLYAIGVVSGFVGYLLFVAVTTTYIVVDILLGERDLVDLYCDEYRRYKDRVSIVVAAASRNTRLQAARYAFTWAGLAPADRASFAWRLPSFDHPVGSGQQRRRHREAERRPDSQRHQACGLADLPVDQVRVRDQSVRRQGNRPPRRRAA